MGLEDWSDDDLIETLLEAENLSDWEVTFSDDIDKYNRQFGSLTPGQREKAKQIIEERELA